MEKIYANAGNKSYFIEIHSVGQKVHEEEKECKGCEVKKILDALDKIIEETEAEEATFR